MDQVGWLTSADPGEMLWTLEGKGSPRLLRLFAVACVRRVLGPYTARSYQRAIAVAEGYADGLAEIAELTAACEQARDACRSRGPLGNLHRAVVSASGPGAAFAVATWTGHFAALAAGETESAPWLAERVAQARLLRCIFGNPFRPAALSAPWRSPGAVVLARQAYQSRDFSDLPRVADLLAGAGCTEADLLAHCRAGAEHVRGCWVVDCVRSVD